MIILIIITFIIQCSTKFAIYGVISYQYFMLRGMVFCNEEKYFQCKIGQAPSIPITKHSSMVWIANVQKKFQRFQVSRHTRNFSNNHNNSRVLSCLGNFSLQYLSSTLRDQLSTNRSKFVVSYSNCFFAGFKLNYFDMLHLVLDW